jgi:hypothetical protein
VSFVYGDNNLNTYCTHSPLAHSRKSIASQYSNDKILVSTFALDSVQAYAVGDIETRCVNRRAFPRQNADKIVHDVHILVTPVPKCAPQLPSELKDDIGDFTNYGGRFDLGKLGLLDRRNTLDDDMNFTMPGPYDQERHPR